MANDIQLNVYRCNDIVYSHYDTIHGFTGTVYWSKLVGYAVDKLGWNRDTITLEFINSGGWVNYYTYEDEIFNEGIKDLDQDDQDRIDYLYQALRTNVTNVKERSVLEWSKPLKVFGIEVNPANDGNFEIKLPKPDLNDTFLEKYIPRIIRVIVENCTPENSFEVYSDFPLFDLMRKLNNKTEIVIYFMNSIFSSVETTEKEIDTMLNALRYHISKEDNYNWATYGGYWTFEIKKRDGISFEGWKDPDEGLFNQASKYIVNDSGEAIRWGFCDLYYSDNLGDVFKPLEIFGFKYIESGENYTILFNGRKVFEGDSSIYFPRIKEKFQQIPEIKAALDALELTNCIF
jgi:hypothetical protein